MWGFMKLKIPKILKISAFYLYKQKSFVPNAIFCASLCGPWQLLQAKAHHAMCFVKDFCVLGKKMTINGQKMAIMSHKFPFFSYKIAKKWKQNKNVFYVTAFDLIKILRSWASQNDRHILSFMKAIDKVGKKLPETVQS